MPHAPRPTQRATDVRWLILALAIAVSWFLYLHRYAWGVIRRPLAQQLGLGAEQLGWLDGVFTATYAAAQVPSGLAGDLFGPRIVLVLAVVGWSLVLWLYALAGGFWSLAGVRALFGLTQAPTYPNLGKVTHSWFPPHIRTAVQGAVGSLGGRAGGACATVVVATVLMGWAGLSWQAAMVVLMGSGLVLAGLFWIVFRNTPAEHRWTNLAERELIDAGRGPAPAPGWRPRLVLRGAAAVTLVALLTQTFSATFADMIYPNWIPTFLEEAKGLSIVSMGVYASLPLWGGALGGLCGGFLNDFLIRATGSRRWGRSLVGCVGPLVAAGLLVASVQIDSGRAAMFVVFFAKFFVDWGQPTVWGTTTDIAGPRAGTIFGLANMTGSIGGAVAGPAMGYIKAHAGWETLFYAVAVAYVVSGCTWLAIDCTKRVVAEPT